MTSEDTTARDRLLAAMDKRRGGCSCYDSQVPSGALLDALLARPDDLAEVAGLYTAEKVADAQTSEAQLVERGAYRRGQRETAEKIAEAIEALGATKPARYKYEDAADIARSFAGGEEET